MDGTPVDFVSCATATEFERQFIIFHMIIKGEHAYRISATVRTDPKAIHGCGRAGAGAADLLNMTQSALSHQVKGLEDQAGVELFVRRSKPLKLSAAGLKDCCAPPKTSCRV